MEETEPDRDSDGVIALFFRRPPSNIFDSQMGAYGRSFSTFMVMPPVPQPFPRSLHEDIPQDAAVAEFKR